MEDGKIVFYMESLDQRVAAIEKSISIINHELGVLSGSIKASIVPMLIKFVIFPLIIVVGAVVGIKLVF